MTIRRVTIQLPIPVLLSEVDDLLACFYYNVQKRLPICVLSRQKIS